jgi:hypothetical protein
VADEAILFRRRVYPDKWPAFIDMAGIAEQVRTFSLDHSPGQRAMDVVAITAFYFSLQDWVAGLLAYLGFRFPMALKADGKLIDFGVWSMHGMAGGTGYIISPVLAHIPIGHIGMTRMTRKAYPAHLFGAAAGIFAEGGNIDAAATSFFHMHRPCAVAGFTCILLLSTFD